MAYILRYTLIVFSLFTFSFSETFEAIFNKKKNNNLFNQSQEYGQNNDYSNPTQKGFFDRFYIYGSKSNHKEIKEHNSNVKEDSTGINVVKTLGLPFDIKSTVTIDAKAIFDNYYKSGYHEDIDFNEIYIKAQINGIDVSIGREYVDFSVAKTYTMLDFISKPLKPTDMEDSEILKEGSDGINIFYTPSWLEGSKAFFYITTNYINKSKKQVENNKIIGRLELKNPHLVSNVYAFYDNRKDEVLALSVMANISKDAAIYTEARYMGETIDYLIGVKYEAYKNIQVLVERLILKSGYHRIDLEKRYTDINKTTANKTLLAEHYNKGLGGNHYINGFVKYSFPNSTSSLYISAVSNMVDESVKVSTKVDYWYGRIRLYLGWIRNIGSEGTEFNYQEDSEVKFHVSINLVDDDSKSNFMK